MEEMTTNTMQLLTAYGPLGVVAIYFMVKDWVLSKSIKESIDKFTIAINVLNGKGIE